MLVKKPNVGLYVCVRVIVYVCVVKQQLYKIQKQ